MSNSLVKYDTPLLVSESKKKGKVRGGNGKRNGTLPPVLESKHQISQTEDILNAILPPRRWEDNGQGWMQYVSSTPATRLGVINLTEQLDQLLVMRKAKETGICPVREQLYAETFDELIRQVTVNCAERGILLLRVRDEIRMTITAYRTLYESSTAFGIRKALLAEQGHTELLQRVRVLEKDKEILEKQLSDLQAKFEASEKQWQEKEKEEEKKFEKELCFYKKQNQLYKQELDKLLGGASAGGSGSGSGAGARK